MNNYSLLMGFTIILSSVTACTSNSNSESTRASIATGAFGDNHYDHVYTEKKVTNKCRTTFELDAEDKLVFDNSWISICALSFLEDENLIVINTDALFKFGTAKLLSLNAEKNVLRDLVRTLRKTYAKLEKIYIVGHTDHIGSEYSNLQLSYARANYVAGYLENNGFDTEAMEVIANGERQPVVICDPLILRSADLVTCLQPNRRVNIKIVGYSRL